MNMVKSDSGKMNVMKREKEILFAIVFIFGLILGILITYAVIRIDNLYECIKSCV